MDVNNQRTTPIPPEPKKPGMKLVGFNLLTLLGYGALSVIAGKGEGLILYALLIVIHFLFCICAAIYKRNWMWVLSAFLILAIGFSTCVGSGSL
ncbi:hypothetical protein [Mucilaginibacter auburnensis]|uniref:Uncharacterized protein n=1 Tax=Mucilaginibacter auburnensis TaxID=1457233 RepID=A0A2H9VUX4_9SPHI|nr:hypothetical protein [Mucilaginibacter auburnensis]PJJ84617.1 hypothetical protein CLV57_1631 [Mucilaginibacter auburnensis]